MKYWTTTFIIPNYKWIKRHTEKSNLFENRRARVWIWEVCLSLPDQERYVILLCLHCDLKSHGNSGNKSLTMFLSLLLFSEESGEADYCTSQSFSPSKCNWSLFFFFFPGRPRPDIPYTMARYMGMIYQQTLLLSVCLKKFISTLSLYQWTL